MTLDAAVTAVSLVTVAMWEGETLYAPSVWAAYNNVAQVHNSPPNEEEERRLHDIMRRVRATLQPPPPLGGIPPPPGGATLPPQAGPLAGAFSGGLSDSLPPVRQRPVCSYGCSSGASRAAPPPATSDGSTSRLWGGSLEEVLRRPQPQARGAAAAASGGSGAAGGAGAEPEPAGAALSFRQRQQDSMLATLAAFGGGLADACPPQAQGRPSAGTLATSAGTSAAPPPPPPPPPPRPIRPRVSIEDFGGSLGDILQPQQPGLRPVAMSGGGGGGDGGGGDGDGGARGGAGAGAVVSQGRDTTASLAEWGGTLAEVLGPRRSLDQPPRVTAARREGREGHERSSRATAAAHQEAQYAYEDARARLHAGATRERHGPRTRGFPSSRPSGPSAPSGFPAAAAARAAEARARAGADEVGAWQDEGMSYEHLMAMHAESNPPAHTARTVSADWVERTAALQPATLADAPADALASCAECSICIEPLFCGDDEAGDAAAAEIEAGPEAEPVCKVLCGHLFHRRCISEWLKHDLRCPNCRFDLLHCEHT